jgi:hypothetical protein
MMSTLLTLPVLATGAAVGLGWWLKKRGLDFRLIPPLLRASLQPLRFASDELHVFLCIADHYEPLHGASDRAAARQRVERWVEYYPQLLGGFCDSDGRPPRHTFFYPLEEYDAEFLDALAELCRQGYGEVEVQLHHDNDTAQNMRRLLLDYKYLLAEQHGLLASHRESGELAYGFVHGNWALCNSRPDGCWCGVNEEIDILRETGCYADFTMPSAPHPTQARKINRIYYARNQPNRPRSHDAGQDVGAGPMPERSLMLIPGPLVLKWSQRKWGVLPRLENGCLQKSQPPSLRRLWSWLQAGIQIPTRPDWYFVKLHAHGGPEQDHEALLGTPMMQFHRDLAEFAGKQPQFHYHYVTAREMYNLVKAAEAGWQGSALGALNYQLLWNGDGAARFQRGERVNDPGAGTALAPGSAYV